MRSAASLALLGAVLVTILLVVVREELDRGGGPPGT